MAYPQHHDLKGTIVAEITNSGTDHNTLEDLSQKFKIDESKLKLIALNIKDYQGSDKISVDLICIDIKNSNSISAEKIVQLPLPDNKYSSIFDFLQSFNITLSTSYNTVSLSQTSLPMKRWNEYMEEE